MRCEPYPYSKEIADKLKEYVRNGVSVKDMMAGIQHLQNAPASRATVYKIYGADIAEVKAEIVSKVGGTVVDQAIEGDFKSQELYLRSHGGWTPKTHVQEESVGNEEEEQESAVEAIMRLLGKDTEDE